MKTSSDQNQSFGWLTPHGEMPAYTRSMDWSSSLLGNPESWPQNLKTTMNIVMNSEIPMFIWWGPNYINIYNDALARIIESSNTYLPFGKPAQEMWPEIWNSMQEYADQVYATSRALLKENIEISSVRNINLQKRFFTFSFSPVMDERGNVCGTMAIVQETTDSILARRYLKAEREKLNSLLMQAPIPMCTLEGPEHIFTIANPKYVELAGREVLGKSVREVFTESEAGHFFLILDKVYETGDPFIGRETLAILEDSDGTKREKYFDFGYHPFRAPDGKIQGIIAVIHDITEHVNIRKTVEKNSTLLNAISEASPDFIFAKDLDGRMIFANPAIYKTLGKSADEIIGHTDRDFLGDEVGMPIMNNDRRIMNSGVTETVEEVLQIGDSIKTYITNKVPYKDQNNNVIGLLGVSRDVTELRKVEGAFESSELRYRTVTEALPQLVWGCLPDGNADYLSRQWVDYTGIEQKLQLGNAWLELVIHPDDRDRTRKHWMDAVSGISKYDIEYRIRNHQGTYRWFKALGAPLKNKSGEIIYWFGTCTDIEDQKRNEEVLKTINEVGKTVSAELDLNNLVQKVTDAATSLTGAEFGAFFYNVVDDKGEAYTLYTLSGAPREAFSKFPMPRKTAIFAPTFHNKGIVRSDDITKDPRYGQNHPYQGMPKGHLPVVSYLAVPVVSRFGEALGALFFGHSKKGVFKDQEEEVIKAIAAQAGIAIDNARLYKQSKDTIRIRDEFLSIASHELRTPLTGMKIQTEMFKRTMARSPNLAIDGARVTGLITHIDRSLDRLVRLVEDMLDISRIQNGKMTFNLEKVCLSDVLMEAVERFRPDILNSSNTLKLNVRPDVYALIDRFRIEQVFTNLISNAVRYAPGTLIEISLSPEIDYTLIRFRDYGKGIKDEDREKIFKRFERLISANEISGMGLGLYICKEIIEGHGGEIEVDPNIRDGACFEIKILTLSKGQMHEK